MYTEVCENFVLLALQQYIKYTDLVRTVHSLSRKRFHVRSDRDDIRDAILNLYVPAPFDLHTRFPDELFVLTNDPLISSSLDSMMNALDLPDRIIERSPVTESLQRNLFDSKRAYNVAFKKLRDFTQIIDPNVLGSYGIYNCVSFERRYHLTWSDSSTKSEPDTAQKPETTRYRSKSRK